MVQRTHLHATSLREELLRAELARVPLLRAKAREEMRFWALRYRTEVRRHGRSELAEAMLDMAAGWRSLIPESV